MVQYLTRGAVVVAGSVWECVCEGVGEGVSAQEVGRGMCPLIKDEWSGACLE